MFSKDVYLVSFVELFTSKKLEMETNVEDEGCEEKSVTADVTMKVKRIPFARKEYSEDEFAAAITDAISGIANFLNAFGEYKGYVSRAGTGFHLVL